MSPLYGHHGQYLRIDLSSRTVTAVRIDPELLQRRIGGSGLGTELLRQETAGKIDALGPEAALLFVFSPLVGSPLTTSAKFSILAKSPLTQRINDSLSSSHFAIAGKRTGYDAFCITGQSTAPVFIKITSKGIEFCAADNLWGCSSDETASQLRSELGKEFRVAAIGVAGENLVSYATISNEGRHAGRGGLGAVMGSKRLKAIAVRGERLTPFAHPEQLIRYSKELSKSSFGEATAKYRELGTVSNLLTFNRLGTLPTRNFQASTFASAEQIAPEQLSDVRTRHSCAACTIGCEHLFQPTDRTKKTVRLEYENLYALGPLCGISDPEAVLRASAFCDEVGIDTISAGASVSFAMECAERGLIDEPELRFGNDAALLSTLQLIAEQEGIGKLLSQGVRAAAAKIGQGSEAFAIHVKGLELPGYEPRALQAMALGFAVGTRGADHNRSGAYQVDFSEGMNRAHLDEAAVRAAIETEDEAALMDSLILCKFLRGVFEDRFAAMAEMLELITGHTYSGESLRQLAHEIITEKKRYNIQQGWSPAEDTLPDRFFETPIGDGARTGAVLDRNALQQQITLYNKLRGWSESGYPGE